MAVDEVRLSGGRITKGVVRGGEALMGSALGTKYLARYPSMAREALAGGVLPLKSALKSVATKIDSKSSELSEGARAEAAARAARERTQAEFEAAQRARSQAAKTAAPPLSTSTASQPPRKDSGETECDRLWRAYRESAECFAPYMRRRGGTRVEAYQHCQQLPSPAQQCGPPKW